MTLRHLVGSGSGSGLGGGAAAVGVSARARIFALPACQSHPVSFLHCDIQAVSGTAGVNLSQCMHNVLGTALLPESVAALMSHLFATVANMTAVRAHAKK